jgi:putative FmdB family regulatory protein
MCGQHFEVSQKFADKPLTVHEGCGGPVERLISAPMLHFKGTGWYVTDYARQGSSPATNGSGKSQESKSETATPKTETKSKSESKTESKTESKSESKSDSKPAPASAKT